MIDFLFPSKIGRLSYFFRILLSNLAFIPLFVEVEASIESASIGDVLTLAGILLYTILFIYRPRCRDASLSLWVLIFTIIPILDKVLAILLLFKPSTVRWNLSQNPETVVETAS